MRYLKYIKKFNESKEDIESICRKYDIEYCTINGDGSIDVDDDVYLNLMSVNVLYTLKLNKVKGNFGCIGNNLTSLEGSPKIVGGSFDCRYNNLTSLEGAPKIVGSSFDCRVNNLTSLRGLPEDYEGILYIDRNPVFEIFRLIESALWLLATGKDYPYYKIAHLLNEYDVISQDGKKVYKNNLEEVFNVLGIEMPKDIKLENYEIH